MNKRYHKLICYVKPSDNAKKSPRLVFLVYLVCLVCLVFLVFLVCLELKLTRQNLLGGNVFEAGLEAAQWRYISVSAYQLVEYQITRYSHLHIRIPVYQSAEHQIISVQVKQTRGISLISWDAGPLPADPLIS